MQVIYGQEINTKVRNIRAVVTKKHMKDCVCHECLGTPTLVVTHGNSVVYSCDAHVELVKEAVRNF